MAMSMSKFFIYSVVTAAIGAFVFLLVVTGNSTDQASELAAARPAGDFAASETPRPSRAGPVLGGDALPTPAFTGTGVASSERKEVELNTAYLQKLIPKDGIRPVYEPTFLTAPEVVMSQDTLVIGVEINGDARAYPVSVLNRREMVNDVVGGVPILATW